MDLWTPKSDVASDFATWGRIRCQRTKAANERFARWRLVGTVNWADLASATMNAATVSSIGVVVIGRNEGDRLRQCLRSIGGLAGTVVYVDSGSTDDSVAFARNQGVDVVQLDLSRPFTAARARNTGFERLQEIARETEFLFFIDGDCEICSGWLEIARTFLRPKPDFAIVAGRLRERHPTESIFNRLCDLEWNTSTGEVSEVGGIFVVRVSAFVQVGGFNDSIIAGEEPDLCFRLRQVGWRIGRIAEEMALHDAAMTRLGQWWKRTVRGGHACAEAMARHARSPERLWLKQTRSNWFWGLAWPASLMAGVWPTGGWSMLGFLLYPLMALRVARNRHKKFNDSWRHAILYGGFVMFGKLPTAIGQAKFWLNRVLGRRTAIIEYKSVEAGSLDQRSSTLLGSRSPKIDCRQVNQENCQ